MFARLKDASVIAVVILNSSRFGLILLIICSIVLILSFKYILLPVLTDLSHKMNYYGRSERLSNRLISALITGFLLHATCSMYTQLYHNHRDNSVLLTPFVYDLPN